MNDQTIWIDLDGVIVDFNSFIGYKLDLYADRNASNLTKDDWKTIQIVYPNLYAELSKTEYADSLISYIKKNFKDYKISFLTALPSKINFVNARVDKKYWVKQNFPDIPCVIVDNSLEKKNYISNKDIFIDDKLSNIINVISKGDATSELMITHFDYENTITRLKEIRRFLNKDVTIFNNHNIIEKGWGYENILESNEHYCVKLLCFYKDKKFSMHFHKAKDETWVVLSGKFQLTTINTKTSKRTITILNRGDVWRNKPMEPHQLLCIEEDTASPATIIETSTKDSVEDNYRVEAGDSQN